MKKTHVMIAAAIVSIGFTACENKTEETTKTVEVLNAYVDSVENLTPVYTTAYWTAIDNGYRSRLTEEFQILGFVKQGWVTGPGGGAFGTAGIIVNCPVVFRFL